MPARKGAGGEAGGSFIADAYGERFFGFFAWYAARLFRRSFHAVRIARGGSRMLKEMSGEPGPLMVALSHSCWWDPLVCVLLHQRFMRGRRALGPIDAAELRRFGFMRRLGLFGVDPDDPASLDAMLRRAKEVFGETPRTTFWITPQGRFSDVRSPIELRPGAAALASQCDAGGARMRVACLSIEAGFWVDQRPEIFLFIDRCEGPESSSTSSWHRAITRRMEAGNAALARLVMQRDAAEFETLIGGGTRIHPVYDAVRRVRGTHGALAERRGHTP